MYSWNLNIRELWSTLILVLDVAIVWFVIYQVLKLVRGTRAGRMLLGLGMIGGVFLFSRHIINLPTLNWILQNFLNSIILVVLILFQEDFRRALIKVGLIPGFSSGQSPKDMEVAVREVAQAASELSSRRIGGLIVITRDVGLEEYTEQAIQIDALVSHQLLVSLFLPTSPLHDGGVVIEGDRIMAAGAVLPLSFNPSISSKYGTRHRAAIGLSERTDALCVVISEETGEISLVREGRISKDYDEKALFNSLYRHTAYRQNRLRFRQGKKKDIDVEGTGEFEVQNVGKV